MNDDTTPLDPEQLDELLSAELDGELAAAADDFGMAEAEARARLEATPGSADRRAQFEAARAAVADVPALDDVTAARLRAAARKARVADVRSRRRGAWLRVASIAAAV